MMNRGVLQNSPVQQLMAAGNPSWWPNINNNLMRPPILSSHHHQPPPLLPPPSSFLAPPLNNNNNNHHDDDESNNNVLFHAQYNTSIPLVAASSSSWLHDHSTNHHHDDQQQHHHQQLPESWSNLLLGGVFFEEEAKKMETTNWEEQVVLQQQAQHHHHHHHHHHPHPHVVDVKQETSVNSYNYSDQEFQLAVAANKANWSHHHLPQLNNIVPVSSPQSCVTSFSTSSTNNNNTNNNNNNSNNSNNNNNGLLDFSSSICSENLHSRQPPPPTPPALDRSTECNSGATKKAKVQPSSTPSTAFKVRKEKLGDRITSLHQLVSPFGKTDTASVLLEAIGYIRFLQSQIEALSLPYLNNGAGNKMQPHPLLNDNCLKRKGGPDQDLYKEAKDLRSRGLCLVPVSCTLHVGSENGADYWAPALGGGFR
ncbi:transcription factor bHLH68 isoform X2 [Spinacia oleracea]|uniref:Transcription factor bHLH68 isoform X2 n=1 Tax=Spinacia oleracea TaxID=3562 RepID=A0ABM3RBI4_SPIOL|nr:transcription factor bHLH68-like isoform X2 [Spinacia oleracea]